jgi:hypothetical protein
MITSPKVILLHVVATCLATSVLAQIPAIELELPECIPFGAHAPVYAEVSGEPGGSRVRLYFRRLHEVVEDFYYLEMDPAGAGRYFAVLPIPSDEELEARRYDDPDEDDDDYRFREAAWWRAKDESEDRDPNGDLDPDEIIEKADMGRRVPRDWMRDLTLEELEEWLEVRENEPAEIFAAIYDAVGERIARTPVSPLYVRQDCDVELTELETGYALNLVVGEMAPWQRGQEVFHWQCDGLVTRIDPLGIKREDEQCRACVVAWYGANSLIPLVATSVVTLVPPEDDPVSPSLP